MISRTFQDHTNFGARLASLPMYTPKRSVNSRRRFLAVSHIAGILVSILLCVFSHASMLSRNWCEYETPFFTVYTDMKKNDAIYTAEKVLSYHHATSMFFAPNAMEGTSLNIVLFRHPREFSREFNQAEFVGVMQPSFQEHLLLLAAGSKVTEYMETAFHEYAHYIIRSRLHRPVPRWLEEGLAQYLATLQVEAPGVANIGELGRRRVLVSFLETKHKSWNEILEREHRECGCSRRAIAIRRGLGIDSLPGSRNTRVHNGTVVTKNQLVTRAC